MAMMPQIALFCLACAAARAGAQDVLRGEVRVDIEAPYLAAAGLVAPADEAALRAWARDEAALRYAAMIYGWDFAYEPGDEARGVAERITLTARGAVDARDGRLVAEEGARDGPEFSLWTEYRLSESLTRRVRAWRSAGVAETQAVGRGPLTGKAGAVSLAALKDAALEDAARRAVRAHVRAVAPNRPRRAEGVIALAAFPDSGVAGGLRQISARFRLKLSAVQPYAIY